MKNLLLLLLLANILYFIWGLFVDKPAEIGVAVVNESDLGPPLDISKTKTAEAAASVGAVLGAGKPSDLAAVVGRSCVTLGPFKTETIANGALADYEDQGMRAAVRTTQGLPLHQSRNRARTSPQGGELDSDAAAAISKGFSTASSTQGKNKPIFSQ